MTKAQATMLTRFEEAIQDVLETPLDTERVREWTALRSLHEG